MVFHSILECVLSFISTNQNCFTISPLLGLKTPPVNWSKILTGLMVIPGWPGLGFWLCGRWPRKPPKKLLIVPPMVWRPPKSGRPKPTETIKNKCSSLFLYYPLWLINALVVINYWEYYIHTVLLLLVSSLGYSKVKGQLQTMQDSLGQPEKG